MYNCGVVQTLDRGRVVVATENIEEGAVVCRDVVHAVCALEITKKKVCSSCLRADAGRLVRHCISCHNAFYCSDECQAAQQAVALQPNMERNTEGGCSMRANAVPHSYICDALRILNKARFDKNMTANLRILVEVYAWRAIEREGRLVDHRQHGWYEDFMCLQEHPEVWTKEELSDWAKPIRLLREALTVCDWMAEEDMPDDDALRKMLSRVDSNSFGVVDGENRVVSVGIYILSAMFNHSCDPNCGVDDGTASNLIITAQRPIKKGEEMCITYIDFNLPRSTRMKVLSNQYNFACGCERCESEKEKGAGKKVSYDHKGKTGEPPLKRTNAEKKARRAAKEAKRVEKSISGGSVEALKVQRKVAQSTTPQENHPLEAENDVEQAPLVEENDAEAKALDDENAREEAELKAKQEMDAADVA